MQNRTIHSPFIARTAALLACVFSAGCATGPSRPAGDASAETPAFGTYPYLRDVALLTRRLLWVYAERNGLDASRSLRGRTH